MSIYFFVVLWAENSRNLHTTNEPVNVYDKSKCSSSDKLGWKL